MSDDSDAGEPGRQDPIAGHSSWSSGCRHSCERPFIEPLKGMSVNTVSLWRGTVPEEDFPVLHEDCTTEIVIVGGGVTGISLALNLAEQGHMVILLEAHDIGFGSTGNSTGNLYETVSRGVYRIVDTWGKDVARTVITARRQAMEQIEHRVRTFDIECGFRRCKLYRYATTENARASVENEYEGSLDAGLSVHLVEALPSPLPQPSGAAMVLDGQAQFHPQAYVRTLARRAADLGCRIFKNSQVLEVDTDRRVVQTAGGKVAAREIVLATHSPKGLHAVQAEMIVNREYGLAARIPRDSFPPGIFWETGTERLSVRNADVGDESFFVCVGEEHKTGQEDAHVSIERLESAAQARFGMGKAAFRWSAQNYSPADGLPYIGRDASGCFIATGFETDGLVYGTMAASIISDQITGCDNPFAAIVRASRFSPVKGARGLAEETASTLKSLVKDYVTDRESIPLGQLPTGTGAIVEAGNELLAAYRNPDGTVIAVSPVCTHMKCKVHWNDVEGSWDCPCHGSRFAPDGTVIEGPATEALQQKSLAET
jgi:glycine/D-amino acid oxidase-like deaminating enzyme/nitrite reductase/ring-hydroxylating ferredoxin subunit